MPVFRIRNILFLFLFLLGCLVAWNSSLILYGIGQGLGQLKIVWQARPISEVMGDSNFPETLKRKLKIVDSIRRFSIDSLGLKDTKNYTTVFDQQGHNIMWVVTACRPFELQPKQWKFPIVGALPYKGFFDEEKAREEAKKIALEGWEVNVYSPGGWSTLGWFKDPILSNMLMRSEGNLARLIIHEMVHATIFVKNQASLNENLATFIADSMAYAFLAWKYGSSSPQYTSYEEEMADRQRYNAHVLRGTDLLDSLYKTFTPEAPLVFKQQQKERLIRKIVTTMDTLSCHHFSSTIDQLKTTLPDNTYFMSYIRYKSKQHHLKEDLHHTYGGDMKKMIQDYATKFPFL